MPSLQTATAYRLLRFSHSSRLVLAPLLIIVLAVTWPLLTRAGEGRYVSGEVLIRYQPSATVAQIEVVESSYGLELISEIPHLNTRHYKLPDDVTVDTMIRRLGDNPIIETVEPNYIHHPQAVPSDPDFPEQWSLHNTGQVVNGISGTGDVDIDWPEAMDAFTGTEPVIVAVIDSGVAADHPELEPMIWTNPGEVINGVDDDSNGYVDDIYGWDFIDNDNLPHDGNGHGTLVASLIAAQADNGKGLAGVSQNARVMVLRTFDNLGNGGIGLASTANFLLSTTYASDMGARIINYSAGGAPYSVIENAQVGWLDSQGILLVAAAGNGGTDGHSDNNDVTPFYPASYDQDNVLSVAAVDQDGRLTLFSNYGGTSVDLAAPGANIYGADITRATVFQEDFESGAPGWTQGHEADSLSPYNWALYSDGFGDTWLTDSMDSFGYAALYTAFTDSWAQSPMISLGLNPELEFTAWHQIEYAYDIVYIEASTDQVTWSALDYITGHSFSSCPSCSLSAGSRYIVDLSPYEGENLYIRFRLDTDSSVQDDGIYIDDIAIKQTTTFSYDGTQYKYNDGTSFSAPLVSGVAALLMSQRPDLSHRQIRRIILESVTESAELSGLTATGGLLNANIALTKAVDFSPGMIGFSTANVAVGEGDGSVSLVVSRNSGADGAASIDYATQDITATGGTDFVSATGTLEFTDGETNKTITVDLADDSVIEGDETFKVVLSNATGADIDSNTELVVSIEDDDNRGMLRLQNASYTVDESGTAVITVLRETGGDGTISVSYETGDGSALDGQDYTGDSGVLTWPDGDMNARTISIPFINDNLDENAETLTVSLFNVTGGAILGVPASAIITITDNDEAEQDNGTSSGGDGGGGGGGSLGLVMLLALFTRTLRTGFRYQP